MSYMNKPMTFLGFRIVNFLKYLNFGMIIASEICPDSYFNNLQYGCGPCKL